MRAMIRSVKLYDSPRARILMNFPVTNRNADIMLQETSFLDVYDMIVLYRCFEAHFLLDTF